jgi:hypothetical protein
MWHLVALKQPTRAAVQPTSPTRLQALAPSPFRQQAFCTQHLSFLLLLVELLAAHGTVVVVAQAA